MKNIIIVLASIISIVSCSKDSSSPSPVLSYPEQVAGTYNGVRMPSNYTDTTLGPNYDTIPVIISVAVTQITTDTILEVTANSVPPVNPTIPQFSHTFKYQNDEFRSISNYPNTILEINNDSLSLWHQAGQAPIYMTYKGIKAP